MSTPDPVGPVTSAPGGVTQPDIDAELRSVTKVYPGGHAALHGISLQVGRGEFFSILGPSGCGKSTTLRLIAGLEQVTTGQVLIKGEDMHRRPAHKRPTNLVFQRLALFPHLDVAANIAFGLRIAHQPSRQVAERVGWALSLVDLDGYQDRRPDQLSGGQQQRVAIARALVNSPAVLLLDEPLGALDLRLRVQLQRALKRIQQESGTTFIYVTHDQTEAFTLSDRIAVMNDGRIEQIGSPEDLYNVPRTKFAAQFVGDTNLFEGTLNTDGRLDCGGIVVGPAGMRSTMASVRPERITIDGQRADAGAPTGADVDQYDATLVASIFQGDSVRYEAQLAGGRRVVCVRPNGELTLAVGVPVKVSWPRSAVVELAG